MYVHILFIYINFLGYEYYLLNSAYKASCLVIHDEQQKLVQNCCLI